MGLIGSIFGARDVAGAVGDLAEVFVGNRAERDAAQAAMGRGALDQYAAEFEQAPTGWFDRFMNGLNRLPRPLLVAGTLGLFAYSMISPEEFARRMESLALVPEPLWWLLGAIVSFYFGARELHYSRSRSTSSVFRASSGAAKRPTPAGNKGARPLATPAGVRASDPKFNAAVEEWRSRRR